MLFEKHIHRCDLDLVSMNLAYSGSNDWSFRKPKSRDNIDGLGCFLCGRVWVFPTWVGVA